MINHLYETASRIGSGADIIFALSVIAITILFATFVIGSLKLKK